MRKIFTSIVCNLFTFFVLAQYPKKIELYDVVKLYAPDSVKGDIYPGAYDWNIGSDKRSAFKWKTDAPEFTNNKTMKKAQAIMTIKDSSLKCNGGKEPCPWSLILYGARMGFTQFNIVSPTHPQIKIKSKIEDLFPGKKYTAAMIKSCDISNTVGFYFYELIIPGKKKMLMKVSWASAAGGSALALVFFTDLRDADMRCVTQ